VPPIKFYKALNSDNISVKVMGKTEQTFHIEIIVAKSVPDNLNYLNFGLVRILKY